MQSREKTLGSDIVIVEPTITKQNNGGEDAKASLLGVSGGEGSLDHWFSGKLCSGDCAVLKKPYGVQGTVCKASVLLHGLAFHL